MTTMGSMFDEVEAELLKQFKALTPKQLEIEEHRRKLQRQYEASITPVETDEDRGPDDLRQFGYSRDKRGDCRQVVIALIVTPEGFPLSYEVMGGGTADSTTLSGFLDRIEQHGDLDDKQRNLVIELRGLLPAAATRNGAKAPKALPPPQRKPRTRAAPRGRAVRT